MERSDISPYLVHLIRGHTDDDAYCILRQILDTGALLGGTGYIRGGYRCVCFSEAPLAHLSPVLQRAAEQRLMYRPFGVILPKPWLFERGGRPVIYQADSEYDRLPEGLRWRHVRYEPAGENRVDFTWEREWRVMTDRLELDRSWARVLVPNEFWERQLWRDLDAEELHWASVYADLTGAPSEMFLSDTSWHLVRLAK